MDGRRRQWIAVDVNYYASDFGTQLRHRFGPVGLVVFDGFLRACKQAHVEGQITYSTTENFLSQLGMADLELHDEAGDNWSLDTLWRWLGDRHLTARRRRHGLTTVSSRRWDEWQTRRSDRRNTAQKPRTETETEKDTDIPPSPPAAEPNLTLVETPCERCNGKHFIGRERTNLIPCPVCEPAATA